MRAAHAMKSRSRLLRAVRSVLGDSLYRGSLILLVNTLVVSAIGFAFWTLAARTYPASTVGVFSSLISGAGLLAAIAALGLPNAMIRHLAGAENPLGLVAASVTAIVTVGTALCLATVLTLGSRLPPALHLHQHGGQLFLVIALVVLTAVGSTFDAGLIATRATHAVLIKNVIGSMAKIAALYLLMGLRSSGLLISFSLGLGLTTVLGGISLGRRISGNGFGLESFRVPRRYLSLTSGNYIATIMGILPVSLVPVEVLLVRGAAETARFAVAFLIAGFLNVIPSTVAQVMFAEASRKGVALGGQLRSALRGVYGLLLPAVIIVVAAAPLALRIFGAAYAAAATGCLRVLALSALLTGGTYIVDAVLIARDRMKAYIVINGVNAALVLGCVWVLLRRGLAGAADGWALAQALSLILGLIFLATGKAGRHHARVGAVLPATSALYQERTVPPPGG
jgi:O-antigen/teichoic acid export membrane protein